MQPRERREASIAHRDFQRVPAHRHRPCIELFHRATHFKALHVSASAHKLDSWVVSTDIDTECRPWINRRDELNGDAVLVVDARVSTGTRRARSSASRRRRTARRTRWTPRKRRTVSNAVDDLVVSTGEVSLPTMPLSTTARHAADSPRSGSPCAGAGADTSRADL